MSPTLALKENQLFSVTGSPGGSTIPTNVLQVIIQVIDHEISVNEAVNTPRIHYQGLLSLVIREPFALPSNTCINLWERGYKVIAFPGWGAAETIGVEPETAWL